MQPNAIPTPHTWQEFIWLSLAAILGYSATWLPALFRRTQTKADVEKTQAETRQIDLNTTIHAGDMMIDLMKLSAQATLDVERLRREKEFWQAKAETETLARELAERQLDDQIRIGKPSS